MAKQSLVGNLCKLSLKQALGYVVKKLPRPLPPAAIPLSSVATSCNISFSRLIDLSCRRSCGQAYTGSRECAGRCQTTARKQVDLCLQVGSSKPGRCCLPSMAVLPKRSCGQACIRRNSRGVGMSKTLQKRRQIHACWKRRKIERCR